MDLKYLLVGHNECKLLFIMGLRLLLRGIGCLNRVGGNIQGGWINDR